MPDPPVRSYWDANVLLSYINGIEDRAPTIQTLLDEAVSSGTPEIITSTFSIVEVSFAAQEQIGQALDDATLDRIEKLWTPPSPIKLVEFHAMIAQRSRDLIRMGLPRGWHLKPMDAIHLATAQHMGAATLLTYDDQLYRYSEDLGLNIIAPVVTQPQLDL